MTTVTVQAWRVDIAGGLNHTYVASGTQGNPPPNYFACWGPSYAQGGHPAVCSGNIIINRANCYRDSVGPCPDTAGIGIYGINGVCHQSANCFLFSGNVVLNFEVAGYWLSLLAYGVYGTQFWDLWLPLYGICSWFNPWIEPAISEGAAAEPSVTDKIRDLYASYMAQPQPPDPHQRLIDEAATVTTHFVPEADPSKYRDLHAEFLKEKDAVIATGITGQALADKLNSLSKQLQGATAQRVGAQLYKKLNGVDAGQMLDLCDPRLADIVGRPVPPFKHG